MLLSLATQARADDWLIGSAHASPEPLPPRVFSLSLERKPLPSALSAFSTQTGIQIIYDTPIAAGRLSAPVNGRFDAPGALEQLLSGTGLVARQLVPNAYTLVPEHGGSPDAAAGSPATATALALPTVRVEAPEPQDHRLYAMTVQYAIQAALQQDPSLHQENFGGALLLVWLNAGGGVQQSAFRVSTGDAGVDAGIASAVRKVTVGQAPPGDLPQPVYVHILAQTAKR